MAGEAVVEKAATDATIEIDQTASQLPEDGVPYSAFSLWQRRSIVALVSAIGLLSPFGSNMYTPAIPTMAEAFDVSIGKINLTVTSYLVFQGIAPTLCSLVGDTLGRRTLYGMILALFCASCLGLALVPTYGGLVALRALSAIASTSTAVGICVIGDLFDRDRRGGYVGIYTSLGGFAAAFGPVIGGAFAGSTGWRGMFWFLFAFAGGLLVITIVVLPETARYCVGNGTIKPAKWQDVPISLLRPRKRYDAETHSAARTQVSFKAMLHVLSNIKLLSIAAFTGMCYNVWIMTMISASTTYAQRYHLSELHIGLTYISNGFGSLLASATTGRVLNWEYRRLLKQQLEAETEIENENARNRKLFRIERARMNPVIIPSVAYLIAVVVYGWSMGQDVHIAVPITMSFFIGALSTAILAAFSTLIVDLAIEQSFSATACMNLFRCLMSAGGAAVLDVLTRKIGLGLTFTLCDLAIILFGLPLVRIYLKH